MENTLINPFQPDDPVVFLAQGEGYTGPFRPSEVYARIQRRELDSATHCYRESEGRWMRICDHPLFQSLLSVPPPGPTPKPLVPPPSPVGRLIPELKWFLFQNEVQTGPYLESELKRWISTGLVSREAYVWRESLPDWVALSDVSGLLEAFPKAAAEPPADKRAHPRKPLVARIYITNERDLVTGLCRDISVGGMQVLTDLLPGGPGDVIRLNVLPPESLGLKPFAAQGVIVRVLEDGRGFSFRFTDIQPESLRSIESYIS